MVSLFHIRQQVAICPFYSQNILIASHLPACHQNIKISFASFILDQEKCMIAILFPKLLVIFPTKIVFLHKITHICYAFPKRRQPRRQWRRPPGSHRHERTHHKCYRTEWRTKHRCLAKRFTRPLHASLDQRQWRKGSEDCGKIRVLFPL